MRDAAFRADSDDIETAHDVGSDFARAQVSLGKHYELAALGGVDTFCGGVGAGSACFDLDEAEHIAIIRHDVDFASREAGEWADIGFGDPIALGHEVLGRLCLATGSECFCTARLGFGLGHRDNLQVESERVGDGGE